MNIQQLTASTNHITDNKEYRDNALATLNNIINPNPATAGTQSITLTTPDAGTITLSGPNIINSWNNHTAEQQEQITRELNVYMWHIHNGTQLTEIARAITINANDELNLYGDSQALHNNAIKFLASVHTFTLKN